MKAIQSKYLPASETKNARVKAWVENNRVILSWDSGSEVVDNHGAAVKALVIEMKWSGHLVGGTLPDESMAWVFVDGSFTVGVQS